RMAPTMPASAPPTGPPALPRRRALGIVAVGLSGGLFGMAIGCRRGSTGAGAPPTTPSTAPAEPDPLLADLADARRLLDRYDQTVRAHPPLTPRPPAPPPAADRRAPAAAGEPRGPRRAAAAAHRRNRPPDRRHRDRHHADHRHPDRGSPDHRRRDRRPRGRRAPEPGRGAGRPALTGA